MDLGSVAVIGLVAGLAGGAVGAMLVGTVEAMLRRGQPRRQWQVSRATHRYVGIDSDRLDPDSRKVMTLARQEAIQNGHSHIGTEHLAMAFRLHRTPALDGIWSHIAVEPEALRRKLDVAVPPTLGGAMPTHLATTPRVGRILVMAKALATKRNRYEIPPEIFLMAMLDEGEGVGAQTLASFGATAERIREIVDGPKS